MGGIKLDDGQLVFSRYLIVPRFTRHLLLVFYCYLNVFGVIQLNENDQTTCACEFFFLRIFHYIST